MEATPLPVHIRPAVVNFWLFSLLPHLVLHTKGCPWPGLERPSTQRVCPLWSRAKAATWTFTHLLRFFGQFVSFLVLFCFWVCVYVSRSIFMLPTLVFFTYAVTLSGISPTRKGNTHWKMPDLRINWITKQSWILSSFLMWYAVSIPLSSSWYIWDL